MANERDIEILEYKIAELTEKIKTFKAQKISERKVERLEALKLKYEVQLGNLSA